MFKTAQEAFQYLVQQFRLNTGKFPIGKQVEDLMRQANEMISKSTLTLTDEVKPTFSTVDETKLPKAQIEALPLADKDKAAAAVKKKIEAQNVQAKQSIEGGESSGGQRGVPELVDKNFGQTLYIDSSEMMQIMDDAQRKFDAASDAVAQGDFDLARGILRYEIEDNYKLPQATRDAAYDARVFIRRGEGLATDMGYDTKEETLEALNEKIAEGVQTTYQDNWPLYTAPDDASNMKSIEYVDFLDEAGEDFGTPNSQIITPDDMGYEYADGGRVGFNKGGPASAKDFIESTGDSELMDIYIKVLDGTLPEDALKEALEKKGYKTYATGGRVGFSKGTTASQMLMNLYNKLVKDGKATRAVREFFEEKLAEIVNVEKMGVTKPRDVENVLKEAQEISKKQYQSKMEPIENPDLEGVMSALPVDKAKVMKQRMKASNDKKGIQQLADDGQIPVKKGEVLEDGTPDYEYYAEILNDGENDFVTGTETIEELEAMVKAQNDEMAYMYNQYKMGKLDPTPGDKSRARMTFLQRKKEEAEMTDDFRLFTPDEAAELDELETMYEYTDLREKLDSPRKMTDEDLKKLKEFDDAGYEQFMREMNRTKKASGGLAYLMGL